MGTMLKPEFIPSNCAFLLGPEVAIFSFFDKSLMFNLSLNSKTSSTSSRGSVAAIVNFLSRDAGTSFKLCIAISAMSLSKACSSLETNNPLPPIICKGVSVKSPSDSILITSQAHVG